MLTVWPGATVVELARPEVHPHEARTSRTVIVSGYLFVITKLCRTTAPLGTGPKLCPNSVNIDSAQLWPWAPARPAASATRTIPAHAAPIMRRLITASCSQFHLG